MFQPETFLPVWYLRLSRTAQPECIYYNATFYGPLLIIIDYYPILFSFALWVISLYKREVVFLFYSLAMTVDLMLSVLLRDFLFSSSYSRFEGCGNEHEMPSFPFQHLTEILVLFHLVVVYRHRPTQRSMLLMMYLFALGVSVARVYIGINRITEIYAGVLVGFIEASIVAGIFYYFRDRLVEDRMLSLLKLTSNYFVVHDTILFGVEEQLYVPTHKTQKDVEQ